MLLEYFSEFDGQNCGVCDNCLKNKKAESADIEELADQILESLRQHGSFYPKELSEKVNFATEKNLIRALSQLIEDELIVYDEAGKLMINEY